jgi:hypothetical protein
MIRPRSKVGDSYPKSIEVSGGDGPLPPSAKLNPTCRLPQDDWSVVDARSLFDSQVKCIHEYKRHERGGSKHQ